MVKVNVSKIVFVRTVKFRINVGVEKLLTVSSCWTKVGWML